MKYILVILVLAFLYSIKPMSLNDVEFVKPSVISVEVKGHLVNEGSFDIDNYSTFKDLLKELKLYDDSDYNHISLNKQLKNRDVIVINKQEEQQKISINSASLEQLKTLKGVGDVMAQRIIDYREQHSFQTLEALMNVKGIGDKLFQNIVDFITL